MLRTARGEAAVVRLAANLFLRPRAVRALIEYWMLHYVPRPVDDAAAAVAAYESTPGQWMAAFLRVLLAGPSCLVLCGQGRSSCGGGEHWQHWFNVFPRQGASLSVPMDELASAGLGEALAAWHNVYGRCELVWRRRYVPGVMGQHWFDQCVHVDVLLALYSAPWFVAEACYNFVSALAESERVMPAHRRSVDAPPLLEEAMEALQERNLPASLSEAEREILLLIRQLLLTQGREDVGAAAAALRGLCDDFARKAAGDYAALARSGYDPGPFAKEETEAVWMRDDGVTLGGYIN